MNKGFGFLTVSFKGGFQIRFSDTADFFFIFLLGLERAEYLTHCRTPGFSFG